MCKLWVRFSSRS
uniref:Uncharacterized protein n=1 Tax=Rhizophora mucronata TaxID=61149 RepID=A0A2P2PYT2_RHIMU